MVAIFPWLLTLSMRRRCARSAGTWNQVQVSLQECVASSKRRWRIKSKRHSLTPKARSSRSSLRRKSSRDEGGKERGKTTTRTLWCRTLKMLMTLRVDNWINWFNRSRDTKSWASSIKSTERPSRVLTNCTRLFLFANGSSLSSREQRRIRRLMSCFTLGGRWRQCLLSSIETSFSVTCGWNSRRGSRRRIWRSSCTISQLISEIGSEMRWKLLELMSISG